jgi:diguanylate cyclase (GGDEF)-like protein
MSDQALKVLLVDDNPRDAELELMQLRRSGLIVEARVASDEAELRAALSAFEPDVMLCDFAFPTFDGIAAVRIAHEIYPDVPIIFVSGTISEERAAIALRSGAVDYVLKSNLTRLPSTIEHAVREARAKRRLETDLRAAEERIRRHAQRLETLWRLESDVTVCGEDRINAMLCDAAIAIRAPLHFYGSIVRFEENELVVLATTYSDADESPYLYPKGSRIPIDQSSVRDDERTAVWDTATANEMPPLARLRGWHSVLTTRFAAGSRRYALTFGSVSETTFEPADVRYCEVLGDTFAHELARDDLEGSLRASEADLRRNVERLRALWRIANDPSLRGSDRIHAMLAESASAIRSADRFQGYITRIEGDELVVVDVTPGDEGDPRAVLYPPGTRIPIAISSAASELRTRFWDARNARDMPLGAVALGWRAQITTELTAGTDRYVLSFGSASAATFDAGDVAYIEVLADSFSNEIVRNELEASLLAAEARLRRHAERLETLWRIANDTSLHGDDRIVAMLKESAAAIRPQQLFRGVISRVVGSELLVLQVTPDADDGQTARYPVGSRLPIANTVAAHATRTLSWDDIAADVTMPATAIALAWRSVITTQFTAASERYVLTFGSTQPTSFGPDDIAYVEVVAASFANQLQLEAFAGSLRDSDTRSRWHAERLEGLWRIVNNPSLRETELWFAMLAESAKAIRPGQAYRGVFMRIDGDKMIREAVVEEPGQEANATGAGDSYTAAGMPLADTIIAKILAGGDATQAWDDIQASGIESRGSRRLGWRAVIATTFTAGGKTYALQFASREATREPFGLLDHAYIEILASLFGRHVQERWHFDRMAYQQSHDVLTGLFNRSQFRSRARAAALAQPRFAIVLVDVDAFREINETYGHMTGDALLVEVGAALQERAIDEEIVGRVAGDVFGIYIPDPATPEAVIARARRFAEAFAHGFSTGDREGREFIALTASLGMAMAPYDGKSIDDILSHADAALFAAKERGPGSTVAYTAGMEGDPQRRATLRNDLTAAIGGEEFVLYFQPHVDIRDDTVTGCEALIRWQHPTRGLLLPGQFIPFAEQTGIITGIDEWVMRSAFAAANDLSALRPGFRLYFNLSGRQAGSAGVVHAFVRAARDGIAIANIGVEITESDAMRDVESTRRVCRALHRLGVRIAIDDFGTGYSSLSSLKRMPIDVIKIDRTSISGVVDNPQDETIAETIISIAERFGFSTLAEGVERQEEIDWLRQGSCRLAQGYAYSHALPIADFKSWLTARGA